MRFMIMHKNDPQTEAGKPPPPELIAKMGAFIGQYAQSGRFVDGAGLTGSRHRTRLVFRDGRCTIKHGPYAGERELPTNVLQLKVATREQAIGWGERYGKVLGDGELELGKVTEPWDLGLMPEPANAPLQFLLIDKADAESEAGSRSPQKKAALGRLKTEMEKAGVLVKSVALKPSSTAKRLNFTNNALNSTDGPFAESKELIGGYAILDLASLDEALELCRTYAAILGGTLEMDLRLVDQTDDAA
ncbi:MAG TPA: YciI family protein [Polyangiaceae bacterium]|nr:YciI family protein [Polyangiaceae bacterium]